MIKDRSGTSAICLKEISGCLKNPPHDYYSDYQPERPDWDGNGQSWLATCFEILTTSYEDDLAAIMASPQSTTRRALWWGFMSGLAAMAIRVGLAYTAGGGNWVLGDDSTAHPSETLEDLVTIGIITAMIIPIAIIIYTVILQVVASSITQQNVAHVSGFTFVVGALLSAAFFVNGVVAFLPFIGNCLTLLMGLYLIGRFMMAVKAGFHAGSGAALVSVLLSGIVFFMVIGCLTSALA